MGPSIEVPQQHRFDASDGDLLTKSLPIPAWSGVPVFAAAPYRRVLVLSVTVTYKLRLRADPFPRLYINSFETGFHRAFDCYALPLQATGTSTVHWAPYLPRWSTPSGSVVTNAMPDDLILQAPHFLFLSIRFYGRRDQILSVYVRYRAWK